MELDVAATGQKLLLLGVSELELQLEKYHSNVYNSSGNVFIMHLFLLANNSDPIYLYAVIILILILIIGLILRLTMFRKKMERGNVNTKYE